MKIITEISKQLGSKPLVALAPMVNHSERAYRVLTRRYGVSIAYSPMINSYNFGKSSKYRSQNFEFDSCKEDRPLIVQFCGNDPDTLLNAARYVEDHCDAVDVNFGCPQKIARKGNYGAFLMDSDSDIMERIISKLAQNLTVPVTAKIRLPPQKNTACALAKRLENAGCSLLCVHGRTRFENKTKAGRADWKEIKKIKEALKIPIFANGSIASVDDIKACIGFTCADGVCVGESLLGFPSLLTLKTNSSNGNQVMINYRDQLGVAYEYLDLVEQYYTKNWKNHMYKLLQPHLCALSPTAKNLRVQLSGCKTIPECRNILDIISRKLSRIEGDTIDPNFTYYYRHRRV